jgi:hypothetical protein
MLDERLARGLRHEAERFRPSPEVGQAVDRGRRRLFLRRAAIALPCLAMLAVAGPRLASSLRSSVGPNAPTLPSSDPSRMASTQGRFRRTVGGLAVSTSQLQLFANGTIVLTGPGRPVAAGDFSIDVDGRLTTDLGSGTLCPAGIGTYDPGITTSLHLTPVEDPCGARVNLLRGVWHTDLEGTWRTSPSSAANVGANLRDAGLGRWTSAFVSRFHLVGGTVFDLSVADGTWRLSSSRQGAPARVVDTGRATISGDTVVVSHGGSSDDVFQWFVVGPSLRLQFDHTNIGPTAGIPEDVYQRAIYTTEGFTRAR